MDMEWRKAELPEPSRWKARAHIGMGLLALSAGAGELYAWPRLVATQGKGVAWLLLPAALLQLPILVECQRLAIMSGESLIPILARRSKFLAGGVFIGFLFAFLWLGGWIGGSAYGLWLLTGFPQIGKPWNTLFWVLILCGLTLSPFVLGRSSIHRYLHRILSVFAVMTFALCALVVMIDPRVWLAVPDFLRSMVSFDIPGVLDLRGTARSDLLTAVIFMGMGGFACLMYTNMSLLARYGMAGARGPNGDYLIRQVTGLRGRVGEIDESGYVPAAAAASARRIKKWYEIAWTETTIGVMGNWLTTWLLSLLAYALLHQTGITPGRDWDLLSAQAEFFRPVVGAGAFALFVLLGCAFLLDTWVGFGVLWAQMSSEAVRVVSARARRWSQQTWFAVWLCVLVGATVITLCLQPPGALIRATALCQMVATPVLGICLTYTNYRLLPRKIGNWAKPHPLSLFLLLFSTAAYISLIAWYLGAF